MKKITYIFGDGRISKLQKANEYAKDFYYGYHLINQNNNFYTKILELHPFSESSKKHSKLLISLDKFLNKLTFLQFQFHEIFKKQNYKVVKYSDILIFSTDRLAISYIPILKFKKNIKSIVIVMGLLKDFPNLKSYQKVLRPYLLNLFIKSVDKFIFLGKPEYEFAKKKYPKFQNKFEFIPFSIDYAFWSNEEIKFKKNVNSNQILFIGNDGNRNYEFVKELPKHLKNFKFTFITEQIQKIENLTNVKLIDGNWSKDLINDIKIRDYYRESFLTILPIKNTIQPSGQSVTLQSLAVGTPVLISNFDGFWDLSLFLDNQNIFLVDNFDINNWKDKIEYIYNNQFKRELVSVNGKKLVKHNYNLENFTSKLYKIIEEII